MEMKLKNYGKIIGGKNRYSIIHDLGVHLLDIFNYWFDFYPKKFKTNFSTKNELQCFDFFISFKRKFSM